MELIKLFNLQGSLFIMILAGAVLKRKGIIDESGKRCLTDLCVNIIIPCNIVKSCLIEFDISIMKACGLLLAVGIVMQLLCVFLNRFLFNGFEEHQKKVLQYCTIVSNGGFLGNPVAEGVYGELGLLYASIFLIPMRVVMWSAGTSYFISGGTDKKKVLRNILTHPCLVAVYLGMFSDVYADSRAGSAGLFRPEYRKLQFSSHNVYYRHDSGRCGCEDDN